MGENKILPVANQVPHKTEGLPRRLSGYGFLRTACQPIRIENFEKPYNNTVHFRKVK
jgi:hypothetical protein